MITFLYTLFIINTCLMLGVTFFGFDGLRIIDRYGYRKKYSYSYDSTSTFLDHEICKSSEFKKEIDEFMGAIHNDFWVKLATSNHPSLNNAIDEYPNCLEYSLLENVLAYVEFNRRVYVGYYSDIDCDLLSAINDQINIQYCSYIEYSFMKQDIKKLYPELITHLDFFTSKIYSNVFYALLDRYC